MSLSLLKTDILETKNGSFYRKGKVLKNQRNFTSKLVTIENYNISPHLSDHLIMQNTTNYNNQLQQTTTNISPHLSDHLIMQTGILQPTY